MEKKFDSNFGNIKSPIIMKKIFSLILYKKELDLIIHNKKFQKKLEISIEDIKNTSKKYRITEKNGIVKE